MSERWGPCRTCEGNGSRFHHEIEIDLETGETTESQTKIECWLCGGTGLSGDIQDYPG